MQAVKTYADEIQNKLEDLVKSDVYQEYDTCLNILKDIETLTSVKISSFTNKMHWYNLVFLRASPNGHTYSSVQIGVHKECITKHNIKKAKQTASIDDSAILLNSSYLGYMNSREILE